MWGIWYLMANSGFAGRSLTQYAPTGRNVTPSPPLYAAQATPGEFGGQGGGGIDVNSLLAVLHVDEVGGAVAVGDDRQLWHPKAQFREDARLFVVAPVRTGQTAIQAVAG